MEQDEREVPDLSKGKKKEQGGDAPVPGGVAGAEGGLACGASSSEQDGVPGARNGNCHAATSSEQEGVSAAGNAPGNGRNEDPATIHLVLRGFRPTRRAIAHAMPPSSYRRLPLRSRKQYTPTRFIFAGDAASGITIANAHDPGIGTAEEASVPLPPTTSLGSPSATTSRSAAVSAVTNVEHGAAKNAAMVSTSTSRSEIEVAVDKPCSDDHDTESKDVGAARASSSCRQPSRSRKQRRPDRCISDPEGDAGAAARAKARRGNAVLDTFLDYLVRTSPEQRLEWVRNVTADNVGVREQRVSNVSRMESAGGPEGPPDGSATILAIVAILGASLALSLVACVLFYIVGQRTASGLPDTHPKK